MNALTNDEFAARVLDLAGTVEEFSPTADYDPDGDCVEFLASPDNFYGERVDELVTVYRSEETGEIVGCLLKGVDALCVKLLAKYPGFKIEIRDGKVKLVAIFQAKLWASDLNPEDGVIVSTYQKLIKVAGETAVEVELTKAA